MRREDIQLERLFAAARESHSELVEEMPSGLAGRVIAHWRSGAGREDSWQMLVLIFRRALVCAGVVMLFSLAWGYDGLDATPESDEAYANYEMRADLMP